jgi:jumonji domain-containing protein 7
MVDAFQLYKKIYEESKSIWIPNSIPKLSNISGTQFLREFIGRNVPVVIKNGCRHWKAMDWTIEYLVQVINNDITVAVTPDGRADAVTNGVFMLPFEQRMPIAEFFENLKHKELVYYAQYQNSSFSAEYEALQNDIEELGWAQEAFGTDPDAVNMWIGNSKSASSTHRDPYENIYCVVKGKKIFTLNPPTDTPFMYRREYPVSRYNEDMDPIDTGTKVPWIELDPDNCDLSKYPNFRYATTLKVVLEEGDVLYLPSCWYHKVAQEGDCVIAVNYWYDMQFDQRHLLNNFLDQIEP